MTQPRLIRPLPTANGMVRVLIGDCRTALRGLPDKSVQCVVTSPPYYGLRDYGTATWLGGDLNCDHKAGLNYATKSDTNIGAIRGGPFTSHCGKCGAKRVDSQIGLETTPEEYVAELVTVFREVRRVLRDDGCVWLNLGDCYTTGSGGDKGVGTVKQGSGFIEKCAKRAPVACMKTKDLLGIPWRVAFALQDDGWYLRSDIIWSKVNPMPESITDRPTKSHEHVFLLTKKPNYYYDAFAVVEPAENLTGLGLILLVVYLTRSGNNIVRGVYLLDQQHEIADQYGQLALNHTQDYTLQ